MESRAGRRAQEPTPSAADSRTTTAAAVETPRALQGAARCRCRPWSCTWPGMPEQTSAPVARSQHSSERPVRRSLQARELLRWIAPHVSRHLSRLDSEPSELLAISALETPRADAGRGYLLRVTVVAEALPLPQGGPGALPFGAAGLAPSSLDPEIPASDPPGRERSVLLWEDSRSKS